MSPSLWRRHCARSLPLRVRAGAARALQGSPSGDPPRPSYGFTPHHPLAIHTPFSMQGCFSLNPQQGWAHLTSSPSQGGGRGAHRTPQQGEDPPTKSRKVSRSPKNHSSRDYHRHLPFLLFGYHRQLSWSAPCSLNKQSLRLREVQKLDENYRYILR